MKKVIAKPEAVLLSKEEYVDIESQFAIFINFFEVLRKNTVTLVRINYPFDRYFIYSPELNMYRGHVISIYGKVYSKRERDSL